MADAHAHLWPTVVTFEQLFFFLLSQAVLALNQLFFKAELSNSANAPIKQSQNNLPIC